MTTVKKKVPVKRQLEVTEEFEDFCGITCIKGLILLELDLGVEPPASMTNPLIHCAVDNGTGDLTLMPLSGTPKDVLEANTKEIDKSEYVKY